MDRLLLSLCALRRTALGIVADWCALVPVTCHGGLPAGKGGEAS